MVTTRRRRRAGPPCPFVDLECSSDEELVEAAELLSSEHSVGCDHAEETPEGTWPGPKEEDQDDEGDLSDFVCPDNVVEYDEEEDALDRALGSAPKRRRLQKNTTLFLKNKMRQRIKA